MRRPLIAGNWKMHLTHLEALTLVQQLSHELAGRDLDRVEVAVCPPFTSLRTVQTVIDSDNMEFSLGAQNVHYEEEGAYTGEVSPAMLKALRVRYVIVGHSERRELFGESDEIVARKARAAFGAGLVPIMCCGETEEEREAGATEDKVERQVTAALRGLRPQEASRMVVAYEPIWAIGTGRTATPADAQTTIATIRRLIGDAAGADVAGSVRILYGGSVKAGNAAALLSPDDIDGALVGGSSLEAGEFAAIVRASP
ncbi:MAG TPA: triose-phosphate isomerase [Actinomycetota bacterium]|nr:triose-phosphate isomerase [Actinomycetota bacterium]